VWRPTPITPILIELETHNFSHGRKFGTSLEISYANLSISPYYSMRRTIKLKLDLPVSTILPTVDLYTKAYNFVCQIGYSQKDFNNMSLHKKTYRITSTYLPSQLAISSRSKAYWTLKTLKSEIKKDKIRCPQSKRNSINYDANSYSINFKKNLISLSTISGRVKIPLKIPKYFEQFLTWRRRSAELFIKGNQVYFHITFDKEKPETQASNHVVGIDRGINNVAVTSNNTFHSGKQVKRICNKYQQLRSKLQSCGSKSAKRHLRRLSGKENRFKKDCNHKISKQIISSLPEGCTIVLEDLKWITNKQRGKKLNRVISTWAYFQLEQFLTYKAEEKGIEIAKVKPHFTSQRCSKCGHTEKRNRIKSNFVCCKCGFSLNADLNAARNIKQKHLDAICDQIGLNVNQPIVSTDYLNLLEANHRL